MAVSIIVERPPPTLAELDALVTDLKKQSKDRTLADDNGITYREFVDDSWLPYAKTRVRASTLTRYENLVTHLINPVVGAMPVGKIRRADVRDVMNRMAAKGLAPSTIVQARIVLSSSLSFAETELDLIAKNPCRDVKPPRITKPKLTIPTPRWSPRSSSSRWGTQLECPVTIAAMSGLRLGEVCGLLWSEVDLENRRLHVCRSLAHVGRTPVLSAPKTERANRTVSIPPALVETLKKQHADQARRKLRAGKNVWSDDGFVRSR